MREANCSFISCMYIDTLMDMIMITSTADLTKHSDSLVTIKCSMAYST